MGIEESSKKNVLCAIRCESASPVRNLLQIFKRAIILRKPRNYRSCPITIELNLNAMMRCGGESMPISSPNFDQLLAPKPSYDDHVRTPPWIHRAQPVCDGLVVAHQSGIYALRASY